MDSVTQAVLGGAVSYAVLGRRLGKRAALYGMALGTLPDLDVLIDFGGPIENMTHHRGFSHSFLVQALVAPLFAVLLSRLPFGRYASWIRWCVAVYLSFATHSLADLFTVYGTQILWPLTDHPFAHSILFIVDPVYTIPLLFAVISILLIRDRNQALKVNAYMLGLSTLYLVWCTGAKWI
ncbi:MAG: metal-dependent hydrolase, partial [Deltaproteobacteria bacterium]|nr:metal-dependent hydrolase [Deltaproteobacteria bacterium]